jgi:hypothetical protein
MYLVASKSIVETAPIAFLLRHSAEDGIVVVANAITLAADLQITPFFVLLSYLMML